MRIGYVGLGAMGRALAGRLTGGHALVVFDRNAEAMQTLVHDGASAAADIADLGGRCDIVLLCLPRSSDVEQVLFGPDGLAGALSPGSIVIDQTSGVPASSSTFAARLEAQSMTLIDAPVTGGVPMAAAGEITVIVSGPAEACKRAMPVLHTISPNVFRCGERVGNAQAVKLLNNMMNAAGRLLALEITAAARSLGLSIGATTSAFNKGAGQSFLTRNMLPALADGRPSTDFSMALMVKDVIEGARLAIDAGTPMPVCTIALGLLQGALNTHGPASRLEDIIPFMEQFTGVPLRGDGVLSPNAIPSVLAEAEALAMLDGALAAGNRLITLEGAAAALKLGLDAATVAPIFNNGSGGSRQGASTLAALQGDQPPSEEWHRQALDALTRLCLIGMAHGLTMLVTNEVRAQYLDQPETAGAPADR